MNEIIVKFGELWKAQYPFFDKIFGYCDDSKIIIIWLFGIILFSAIVAAITTGMKFLWVHHRKAITRMLKNIVKGFQVSFMIIFGFILVILLTIYVYQKDKEPLKKGVAGRMKKYVRMYIRPFFERKK